jgi:hypothetical protein
MKVFPKKYLLFQRPAQHFTLLLIMFMGLCFGCKKEEAPPPALTLDQLPAALEKAFAKAKPETSEPVKDLLAALKEKDFPKAWAGMQALSAMSGLNKEQANVAAAGMITVNNALQEAQSAGDQNAAETLRTYHSTK